MKQPKFKLGDTVRRINSGNTFRVDHIVLKGVEWQYSGDDYWKDPRALVNESVLELFQEPQKKKLYAYESGGFINFKRHDSNIHPCSKDVSGVGAINWEHVYKRCPEYDIEYPEGK